MVWGKTRRESSKNFAFLHFLLRVEGSTGKWTKVCASIKQDWNCNWLLKYSTSNKTQWDKNHIHDFKLYEKTLSLSLSNFYSCMNLINMMTMRRLNPEKLILHDFFNKILSIFSRSGIVGLAGPCIFLANDKRQCIISAKPLLW